MVAEVSTAESAAGLARAVVARTDRRTIKLESKRMVIATSLQSNGCVRMR